MFKDNLISLRKVNHLSQEQLAEQLGVSRQTLSKYEPGDNLIILGDEAQGLAIIKEQGFLDMMHAVISMGKDHE